MGVCLRRRGGTSQLGRQVSGFEWQVLDEGKGPVEGKKGWWLHRVTGFQRAGCEVLKKDASALRVSMSTVFRLHRLECVTRTLPSSAYTLCTWLSSLRAEAS